MPSAANAKSEKGASSEATDNSPMRQIVTILDHKIRNLEKRKSKLTSYRDLQKAGKELNSDQKYAVSKYDGVTQTLDFARDLSQQVAGIVLAAERDAKKQAKKDAWVRYAADTNKIREVLLVLDCLTQMGNSEARDDFLNGTNGAVKLTEEDLKILDDLYPEVTPKHEFSDGGQPAFPIQLGKAAEHLYGIIDGKSKEVLGTTYSRIKEIVSVVHECGYFDRSTVTVTAEVEEAVVVAQEEETPESVEEVEVQQANNYPPAALPVPPAPAVVPTPTYPLRPLPPMTLQEVEHAYFSQYPQQRPITEVIGSQNFFFLQESEIDSPVGTPQPPAMPNQTGSPAPIPSQTFTNQHFVQVGGARVAELPPHFALAEHAAYPAGAPPPAALLLPVHAPLPLAAQPAPAPPTPAGAFAPAPSHAGDGTPPAPIENNNEWKETQSPEREENSERKTHGQGDGQNRFRRYGRGGGGGRGTANGHRGRGFSSRQTDGYRGRHGDYQPRSNKDGYQGRYDNYQYRQKDGYSGREDGYYGNGDAGEEGVTRGRGRGARRPSGPPRAHHHHYHRKPDNDE